MKYIYSTLSVIGLLGGVVVLLLRGFNAEALLVFIFGAVCAVAAEVSELGEGIKAQAFSSRKDTGS
jgi:hypothetical protein